jgi:hypothetical protein
MYIFRQRNWAVTSNNVEITCGHILCCTSQMKYRDNIVSLFWKILSSWHIHKEIKLSDILEWNIVSELKVIVYVFLCYFFFELRASHLPGSHSYHLKQSTSPLVLLLFSHWIKCKHVCIISVCVHFIHMNIRKVSNARYFQ